MQLEQLQRSGEALRTSQEVYEAVLSEARPLNILEFESSAELEAFYGEMGVTRTPLTEAHYDANGHVTYIKFEGVQRSGSYKSRGAAYAVRTAYRRALEKGVPLKSLAIASAGNAATGVADAGNVLGLQTTAYVTDAASGTKVGNLLRVGAQVKKGYTKLEDAMDAADDAGQEDGVATIHAFDQIEVIAAQATVGFEFVADLLAMQAEGRLDILTDPVKLFVPIGGGGLISGVACAVRWAKDAGLLGEDNVHVIGVQLKGCDAMKRAVDGMRAGRPAPEDLFGEGVPFSGMADGVAVRTPGTLTAKLVADRRFVNDIVVVNEGELGSAMRKLTQTHGTRVEPAGALSMAGALQYGRLNPATRRQGNSEHVVTITSGVNVDPSTFDYFMQAAERTREVEDRQKQVALEKYRAGLRKLGEAVVKSEGSAQGTQEERRKERNPEPYQKQDDHTEMPAVTKLDRRQLQVWGATVLRR